MVDIFLSLCYKAMVDVEEIRTTSSIPSNVNKRVSHSSFALAIVS